MSCARRAARPFESDARTPTGKRACSVTTTFASSARARARWRTNAISWRSVRASERARVTRATREGENEGERGI